MISHPAHGAPPSPTVKPIGRSSAFHSSVGVRAADRPAFSSQASAATHMASTISVAANDHERAEPPSNPDQIPTANRATACTTMRAAATRHGVVTPGVASRSGEDV